MNAGYVETVSILTQNTRKDIEIATHKCIASLIPLVKSASLAQRRLIFNQMMQHRLLDICVDVSTTTRIDDVSQGQYETE